VWSQIVAYGPAFADATKPTTLVVVGSGGTGKVELQDLLFTSVGNLPGLILVEWNVNAAFQGSAAMWGSYLFSLSKALFTHGKLPRLPFQSRRC